MTHRMQIELDADANAQLRRVLRARGEAINESTLRMEAERLLTNAVALQAPLAERMARALSRRAAS